RHDQIGVAVEPLIPLRKDVEGLARSFPGDTGRVDGGKPTRTHRPEHLGSPFRSDEPVDHGDLLMNIHRFAPSARAKPPARWRRRSHSALRTRRRAPSY